MFLVSGSSDCICPPSRSLTIYDELSDAICKYYGVIVNGTHCHFADIYAIDHECYTVEEAECSADEKNRTIVPRQEQLDLTKNFLLQFANAVLKDEKGSQVQQQHFDALFQSMMALQEEGYIQNATYDCRVASNV